MEEEILINNISELPSVAEGILKNYANKRIFFLYGNLGTGKTTLVQALCKVLGITEPVTSPTFALVQEYNSKSGPVYHMDLYRIKQPKELAEIGVEEYLASGNYCFIEWPELLEDIIEQPYVKVVITTVENEKRMVKLQVI